MRTHLVASSVLHGINKGYLALVGWQVSCRERLKIALLLHQLWGTGSAGTVN